MEFTPYLGWVDVADQNNPPPGARKVDAVSLLRYEQGFIDVVQELASLPGTYRTAAQVTAAISSRLAADSPGYLDRANHTGTQSLSTTVDSATRLAFAPAERTKLTGVATGATVNSTDAALRARTSHTGTQTLDTTTDTGTRVAMTPDERTRLAGIATGATANATDAALRDRATHTGPKAIAVSDLTATGTKDATTTLHGDNVFRVPAGGTGGGGVADHGALTGLADDDHPQYLNNTRADARYVQPVRQVIAGTGLIGGGDLSVNRTLAVAYGTTAITAVVGNDPRVPTQAENDALANVPANTNTELTLKADATSLASKASLEGGTVVRSQLDILKIEPVVLENGQTAPSDGFWVRYAGAAASADPTAEPAGSWASIADVTTSGTAFTLARAFAVGEDLVIAVGGGGNTATFGVNTIGTNPAFTAHPAGATSVTTPHMGVRLFSMKVTQAIAAGAAVTVTRSSGGGLAVIALAGTSLGTTKEEIAPVEGTADPITFASRAVPARSLLVRAITTQDNVTLGSGGADGTTLAGTVVSTGGTSARRIWLLYNVSLTAANVSGSLDLSGASRFVRSGIVIS